MTRTKYIPKNTYLIMIQSAFLKYPFDVVSKYVDDERDTTQKLAWDDPHKEHLYRTIYTCNMVQKLHIPIPLLYTTDYNKVLPVLATKQTTTTKSAEPESKEETYYTEDYTESEDSNDFESEELNPELLDTVAYAYT